MSVFSFAFLLMQDGMVDAAVRSPTEVEITARFPDTEPGTLTFLRWVAREAKLDEEAAVHACLAVAEGGDAQIYGTSFFKFAYEIDRCTVTEIGNGCAF